MSSTRYLEFDSTYRNREMYPYPSDFVVEIAQSGQKTKQTALSPVCDSSPVLIWNNTFVESDKTDIISNILVSPTGPTSSPGNTVFEIITTDRGNNLRQVRNFYVGSNLSYGTGPFTHRRIVDYLPIDNSHAMVTVESAIPDSLVGMTGFFIQNPSPLDTRTSSAVNKVYVPGSNDNLLANEKLQTFGLGGENYYVNHYIQYTDVANDYQKIVAFDNVTRLATLEGPTVYNWAVSADSTGASGPKNFAIRKEIPIERNVVGASTTSTVTLGSTASSISGTYIGDFLRIVPAVYTASYNIGQPSPYTGPYTEQRRIIAYNGTTKVATVNPAFTVAPTVNSSIYEIEPFTRDGETPFIYTGSLVSSQEMVCYEVELLNLILPNTLLNSGRGGRPIFYPYLYVELQQISAASAGNKNIIYSNNPNSYNMLFRAVVDDTPIPAISPFIKIDGDGMVHVIKFKPNDSFHFAVFHANGEPFRTVIEDTTVPTPPNPLAQISACFAFKRI